MSAQLAKIKVGGWGYGVRHHRRRADHSGAERDERAAGHATCDHHRRFLIAGSVDRAGRRGRGRQFFTCCSSPPGFRARRPIRRSPPRSSMNGTARPQLRGLTEGFRGHDGIMTIAAAIKAAGKAEPKAIQKALWGVKVKGVNGNIAFIKQGPAGKEKRPEHSERLRRHHQERQGRAALTGGRRKPCGPDMTNTLSVAFPERVFAGAGTLSSASDGEEAVPKRDRPRRGPVKHVPTRRDQTERHRG